MDPTETEREYNPRVAVAADEVAQQTQRAAALSAATRERWRTRGALLDQRYGDGALATLDVFPATVPDAPVHVFLHGGYWRARDKADYSFVADALAPHGITTVVMNYDLCPAVELPQIVQQVAEGFAWVHAHAGRLGGDPARISASGHSAGAHLIAAVLASDAPAVPRAALLVSGIYELEPVLDISVNAQIRLRPEQVDRMSPMRHPPRRPTRLVVAVGGAETGSWIAQSQRYAEVCAQAGSDSVFLGLPGANHYTVMAPFESATGWLARMAASLARD